MKILITRGHYGTKQIIGQIQLIENCNVVCSFSTLELPYLDNANNVSSIPIGIYKGRKHENNKKSYVLIENIQNRNMITIRSGEYFYDINGCVLVGGGLKETENGLFDVINSSSTMEYLLDLLPDSSFEIEVK